MVSIHSLLVVSVVLWRKPYDYVAVAGYLNLFFVERNHRLAFATFFLSRAFVSFIMFLQETQAFK